MKESYTRCTKTVLIVFLCVLRLNVSVAEELSEQKSLLYVFTNYYPANYVDMEGKVDGFFVEIIKEVFENRLGIPVEMEVYPWARCQAMIEYGEADIITTVPTEERLKWSIASPEPFWHKEFAIFTWTGNPGIVKMDTIQTADDLIASQFSVLSYHGNNWVENLFSNTPVQIIEGPSIESMYKMLAARRGDIVLDDSLLVKPNLIALGLTDQIVRTEGFIESVPFHLLVGKKSKYFHLADSAFKILEELEKDGTIAYLVRKHCNFVY